MICKCNSSSLVLIKEYFKDYKFGKYFKDHKPATDFVVCGNPKVIEYKLDEINGYETIINLKFLIPKINFHKFTIYKDDPKYKQVSDCSRHLGNSFDRKQLLKLLNNSLGV